MQAYKGVGVLSFMTLVLKISRNLFKTFCKKVENFPKRKKIEISKPSGKHTTKLKRARGGGVKLRVLHENNQNKSIKNRLKKWAEGF